MQENQLKIAVDEGNISNKIPFVVCIDDQQDNLDILGLHLKKAGIDNACFLNGNDGMKFIDEHHDKVDAVLLDLMMPEIDGIKVLKGLKANFNTMNIPVIMQTAVTQEEKTLESIEEGAYYYITRPYSHSILISIVKSAIREKRDNEGLKGEVLNFYSVLANIRSSSFEIKTFAEARKLSNFIARLTPDPAKYIVGLTSLMVNAIEHGNLDLGYDAKAEALREGRYDEEIQVRTNNPLYKDRKAVVEVFRKDKDGIYQVIIKDEGKGFDWNQFKDFDPKRMSDPNGRGIVIASITNQGNLEYWGNGSTAVYKIPIRKEDSQQKLL